MTAENDEPEAPVLLHVLSTFDPGGPEVRAVEIMNASAGQFRHAITAIDGRYGAAARISQSVPYELVGKPGPGRTIKRQFTPIRLARSLTNIAIETYRLRKFIRELRPDLVLSYGSGAISAPLSVWFARVVPIICFEDGFGAQEMTRRNSRLLLLRRIAFRRAYRVVVPSLTLEEIAKREFGVPSPKLCRIPNGVDTARFEPMDVSAARALTGIPQDAFVIGTVCHLRGEKRLDILISAFAKLQLPNAKLLIVGDGPCGDALRLFAENLAVNDRIIWAGAQNEPKPWLASMTVFVSTSVTEQMPLAILEAMSCARPVIATDVGDCRYILGEQNRDWILPARDVEALAEAIGRLANRTDRCTLGMRNRERVIEQFSQDRMVSKHLDLYREAICAKRSQTSQSV